MKAQRSPRDWQTLSAYIDGKLSSKEAKKLEEQLRLSADLRLELAELKATRHLVRSLPRKRAPRNFTLSPQMLPKRQPGFSLVPLFSFSSALAGILAVVVLALNMFSPAMPVAQAPERSMRYPGAPASIQSLDSATETPMIITWNKEVIPPGEGGLGGGDQETPAPGSVGIDLPTPVPEVEATQEVQRNFAPEGYPAPDEQNESPILGVRTPQPDTGTDSSAKMQEDAGTSLSRFLLPILLGTFALITGALAFFFHRKNMV